MLGKSGRRLPEADVLYGQSLGGGEIGGGREAAVEARLARRAAEERALAAEHRYRPGAVGRIALGDGTIEDEPGGAAREEDLVPVGGIAPVFDDHVGMRHEERDELLLGGDGLAVQHAARGLADDVLGAREHLAELAAEPEQRPRGRQSLEVSQGAVGKVMTPELVVLPRSVLARTGRELLHMERRRDPIPCEEGSPLLLEQQPLLFGGHEARDEQRRAAVGMTTGIEVRCERCHVPPRRTVTEPRRPRRVAKHRVAVPTGGAHGATAS